MATAPASIIEISGLPDSNGNFTSNYDPDSTTPDQFYFTNVLNAILGGVYEDSVTITGINAGSAPISISNGEYKIGAGAFTTEPGIVSNGQTVTVRLTASSETSDPVSLTLTVGDVSGMFTITTESGAGVLIGFADFADNNTTPESILEGTWWGSETNGGTLTAENGTLILGYPADGNGVPLLQFNMPDLDTREFFLEFDAQMPNGVDGCKFVKVFGKHPDGSPNIVANTTFGLDYTGAAGGKGTLNAISYGDGSENSNDSQNIILLDGSYPEGVGRSYPDDAVVLTPQDTAFTAAMWGSEKHHFRIRCKFNSGTTAENEVPDGAYYLEIDGEVYVDASGIFNRHYSNLPIDYIRFGDYTTDNEAFVLSISNIKFSTGDFMPGIVAEYLFNDGDLASEDKGGFSWALYGQTIETPAGESESQLNFPFGGSIDPGIDSASEARGSFNQMGAVFSHIRLYVPPNYYHRHVMRLIIPSGSLTNWQVGDNVLAQDGLSAGTVVYVGINTESGDDDEGTNCVYLRNVDNELGSGTWVGVITNTTRVEARTATARKVMADNNKLAAFWSDTQNLTGDGDGYSQRGAGPTVVFEMRPRSALDGGSTLYYHFGADRDVVGNLPNSTSDEIDFITPSDFGTHIDIAFRIENATSESAEDGIIECHIKKQGETSYTEVFNQTNCMIGPRADSIPPNAKFGHLYFNGYWNMPPEEDVDMGINVFRLSSTQFSEVIS